MSKPEFGDIYRFIASLGLVLLSLGTALPWLIARESFDTRITVDEMARLTPMAQSIIERRQSLAWWRVWNSGAVSAAGVTAGCVMLAAGVILWSRKQVLLDQKESLERRKFPTGSQQYDPSGS